jgi:hypothetical protein
MDEVARRWYSSSIDCTELRRLTDCSDNTLNDMKMARDYLTALIAEHESNTSANSTSKKQPMNKKRKGMDG